MIRILLLSLLILSVYADASDSRDSQVLGALLQAKISSTPLDASRGQQGKIEPGARVKISAVIKNVGDQPNAPGEFFVRFTFPKLLKRQEDNLFYQTEKVPLPTIEPGDFITINFSAPHQWPSLFNYIRQDWAMREYEGVVVIDNREQLIGATAIAFSAYYYEAPVKEKAAKVLSSSTFFSSSPKQGKF